MKTTPKIIDIFCTVIDNYGDAGVCWRLVEQLAQQTQRVGTVRLWIDTPDLIDKLCPTVPPNVQVMYWDSQADTLKTDCYAGDMVIEAFGCNFDHQFVARRLRAGLPPPQWINLEYLSAESWVEGCHGLPSPILHGACAGLHKTFVFPGFTPRTGGLLLEAQLPQRMAAFDRETWLRQCNPDVDWHNRYIVSLFCYPHAPVQHLLEEMAQRSQQQRTALLVCAGHPTQLVRDCLAMQPQLAQRLHLHNLHIEYLPFMPQVEFDHLLWASDFNCVRGEDSIVRAVAADRPLLWHIYPQEDGAHIVKLQAFLGRLGLLQTQAAHALWNNAGSETEAHSESRLLHTQTVGADRVRALYRRSLVGYLLNLSSGAYAYAYADAVTQRLLN